MDSNIQSAMMMASPSLTAPVAAPMPTGNAGAASKAAKEFEGVFISQFLGSMFSGIKSDSMFGGGQGEEMFRSLMIDQYGKQMETRGGFGLASAVQRQLLKHQEAPAPETDAQATDAQATPVQATAIQASAVQGTTIQ